MDDLRLDELDNGDEPRRRWWRHDILNGHALRERRGDRIDIDIVVPALIVPAVVMQRAIIDVKRPRCFLTVEAQVHVCIGRADDEQRQGNDPENGAD